MTDHGMTNVSSPNLTFNLAGRRALVTGSASGIGRATAELLARSGARVAMNDRAADTLDAVVSQLRSSGFEVEGVAGDLGESATAAEVGHRAAERLGGLDYLINNAGAPFTRTPIPASDLEALTDALWDRILRVNLMSAFWMTKALAGALRASRGAVVNNVSIAAFGGGASSAAYATAKAGLAGLTRELARGLAPEVRVNGIAPGYVNSGWECSFGDMESAARATVPLARVGQPEDYAELVVFLCAGAAYITGEVIPITGGLRI